MAERFQWRPSRFRCPFADVMKTLLCLALLTAAASTLFAADLAPTDKEFLAKYEPVRAALAADNLTAAKKAAAALPGDDGKKLAAAETITSARADFTPLSDRAIKLARGVPGYHVVHCPMANKDWVQTSKEVSNPYMGKEMLTCGVVKN